MYIKTFFYKKQHIYVNSIYKEHAKGQGTRRPPPCNDLLTQ